MTDYQLAKRIVVDTDERGAPRVTIDGFVLPWYTCGITVPAPSLNEDPTVTVTFLAEDVQMVNHARFPALWTPELAEAEAERTIADYTIGLDPECASCGKPERERPLVQRLPSGGLLCRECAYAMIQSTEAIEAAIARRKAAASGKASG